MRFKLFLLSIIGIVLLIFFVWVFVANVFFQKAPVALNPSANFEQDYSNLYRLSPGKSNMTDVLKFGGTPVSQKTSGDKTYLYFNTPSPDYKNVVVLKGGVVYYVLENIFGKYRGSFENYQIKYGAPEIIYSGDNIDFPWYIYLKSGIGVQSTSGSITAILYFVPQAQESFYENIGVDLGIHGLTPTPTGQPQGEPIDPGL